MSVMLERASRSFRAADMRDTSSRRDSWRQRRWWVGESKGAERSLSSARVAIVVLGGAWVEDEGLGEEEVESWERRMRESLWEPLRPDGVPETLSEEPAGVEGAVFPRVFWIFERQPSRMSLRSLRCLLVASRLSRRSA